MAKKDMTTSSAEVYGEATRNRMRAILDHVMEHMLTGEKARRDREGRDVYEALADAVLADPIGAMERLHKMLPGASSEQKSGLNINNLYLAAVQAAQQAPAPAQVIDVTPDPW
jgi:hypothetical protein